VAELRGYLSRRISNAVETLYEEVPKEAWPRIASRLEAVGLRPTRGASDVVVERGQSCFESSGVD
jgi:hypothetical protein